MTDKPAAGRTEARPVDLAFAALGKWFHPTVETTASGGHTDDPGACGICWEAAEAATAAVIPSIREQAVRAERERLAAMLIDLGNREPQMSGFRRGLRAAAQHVAAQNINAEDVARALGNALRSTRGDQ